MKDFASSLKRFLVSEDGPTAVEYAVMLALIIVVCLTAIQAVGTNANNKFNQVQNCAHVTIFRSLSCRNFALDPRGLTPPRVSLL